MHINFLNSKEQKPLVKFLESHFGYTGDWNFVVYTNAQGRIYVARHSIGDAPLEKLNIKVAGIYLGEWRNDELRLTIEGSQLLGPQCTKQILELTTPEVAQWMRGEDIPYSGSEQGFVLVRHGADFLGTARASKGKLWNFIPKGRRVKIIGSETDGAETSLSDDSFVEE